MRQTRVTACAVTLVAAWAAMSAGVVSGQDEQSALLRGTVYDSTSMAVLSGARVAVLGTLAGAATDASGRFELRGVPPGSHWVSFFHPRLEELGVSVPSERITVQAGETLELELAVPSEETLLLAACLAEQPGTGYAVLAGKVRDSMTGMAMPRAVVTAEVMNGGSGMPRPVEVRTDDSGAFRLCALAADVDLMLQVRYGQAFGPRLEMVLEPATVTLRDFTVVTAADGYLAGYVRDFTTGDAISGARVSVVGSNSSSVTDLTGRFTLDALPPGRHLLETEHFAFEERVDSVTVFSEEMVDIEVRMATDEARAVEGLVVIGRTQAGFPDAADDAEDESSSITREDIERVLPGVRRTTDLLRAIGAEGLWVRDTYVTDVITGIMLPSTCIEVTLRIGATECLPAAVAVNDVIMPFPDQVLRDLDPSTIDHIEILGPNDATFQFGPAAENGAIVFHTR